MCVVPVTTLSDPYTNYNCQPCPVGGTCGPAQSCVQDNRRRLEGFSGDLGNCDSTGGTECFLAGLTANTQFEVTCVGVMPNGAVSGPSNKGSFVTSDP